MCRVVRRLCLFSGAIYLGIVFSSSSYASICTDLRSLKIPSTTLTSAVDVPAGTFTPTYEKAPAKIYSATVPAFCRVIGVIHPVPESTIGFEVWLPVPKAWNHRTEGVGSGAYAGRISYGPLENAIALGYAVSSTNTGHSGSDLRFAVDHPERIVDWGYRAIHETAQVTESIVVAYYGAAPAHAYFNGCSTGGGQALSEAQRFPEDYDGILAGDAGNDRVHLNAGFLWGFAAAHNGDKLILPESKLQLIHDAAIKACDAADGVLDGILEDPMSCHFDPAVLACKASTSSECLSPQEVEAVRKIYAGPKNPRTGQQIIGGLMPGSEVIKGGDYSGWKNFITGPTEPSRVDFWKYWVFNNPKWDWHMFDYDSDVTIGDEKMAAVNASNPDLRPFERRGGKLLVYHGWIDPVGPPADAINYHNAVEKVIGSPAETAEFFRLFIVPGMSHCSGGDGYELAGGARGVDDPNGIPMWPNPDPAHDMLSALDAWVSHGDVPQQIVAAHYDDGRVERTIPVCAFPKVARWTGKGSSDDAKNYACTTPRR
jgi:feruloyl esterase